MRNAFYGVHFFGTVQGGERKERRFFVLLCIKRRGDGENVGKKLFHVLPFLCIMVFDTSSATESSGTP